MAANQLTESSKVSMRTRIITGVVLMFSLIPCILFGNIPFFVMMAFFSVIGIHEIVTAPGKNKYNLLTKIVVYVFVLSFIYWTFIKNYLQTGQFFSDGRFYLTDIFVSVIGIILYALALFMIAIINPNLTLSDVTYLFTIGIVFALGFQGMFFVRYFPNGAGLASSNIAGRLNPDSIIMTDYGESVIVGQYFLSYSQHYNLYQNLCSSFLFYFLLIGTWMSDVGAYFIGVFFGKHPMNPRISPHKTWEGFIGGVVFSMSFAISFEVLFEFYVHAPLIPGLIQFRHSDLLEAMGVFDGHAWPFIIMLAILMPIFDNVGGFLFSLVKRSFGIKDWGKIFPGHGGVIDRFDGLMVNAIIMAIFVILTSNGWRLTV